MKDVTSFVRFVANPRDEVAFKRMVKLLPGIGNKSADNHWRAWEASLGETSAVAGDADPGENGETTGAAEAGGAPAGISRSRLQLRRALACNAGRREIEKIVGTACPHPR